MCATGVYGHDRLSCQNEDERGGGGEEEKEEEKKEEEEQEEIGRKAKHAMSVKSVSRLNIRGQSPNNLHLNVIHRQSKVNLQVICRQSTMNLNPIPNTISG